MGALVLVLAVVLAVVLPGCGDPGDEVDAGAPSTTTTVVTAPTSPPSPSPGCEVDPAPSGPLTDLGFDRRGVGQPPPGWVDPTEAGFDWDADGNRDELRVDAATGEISVVWPGGALVVTGVRTDFADEPEISVRPAEAADVTGDGHPDLVVAHEGTAAVLVGPGPEATAGTVAFADIGRGVEGWQSPPIQPADVRIPFDTGTVEPLWDLTGDGVDDFAVYSEVRRAEGPTAFYAGRACTGA